MTKEQILQEVANSSWQPKFEFTDDLDAVVDSILKSSDDCFLSLHSKYKEIILDEIEFAQKANKHSEMVSYYKPYQVTFESVCNWQKELFEHKKEIISDLTSWSPNKDYSDALIAEKASSLPNQNIKLGLRDKLIMILKKLLLIC